MTRHALCLACVAILVVCFPASPQTDGGWPLPIQPGLPSPSLPIPPIITPDTAGLLGGIIPLLPKPVDMKLLILGTDGNEPGLAALRYLLDHLGTPYDVVLLATGQTLPPLDNGARGFYQGIILTIGNLGICDPACRSALPLDGWVRLDRYARDYRVRVVSYYTFPEARYGLVPVSAIGTTEEAPGMVSLTPAGAAIFNYLRPTAPVRVIWSWTYLASTIAATGETTTAILKLGASVVGVTHKKGDGREYMALTMDNNPFLFHSAMLHYGIVRWVTKGIFLGSRRVYMTPQVDDHFLASDQFDASTPACIPVGLAADPTSNLTDQCRQYRITAQDLVALAAWQRAIRLKSQFSQFRVTMAFNGFGATAEGGAPPGDGLVAETRLRRNEFFWVNHTYDHENLDCFLPVPNSGVCRPATETESLAEIADNVRIANSLGLPLDAASMVTPGISGLNNPAFLRAAVSQGIRYLIADLSRPEGTPASPNTGIWNPLQPSILMIPRRPTNIFYNTTTAVTQLVGSEPDEYNYFYGPSGIFRIGGPGGPPFFTTNQTWDQIRERESDALLGYMLRPEAYPSMFHQGNLYAYDGTNSLFSAVVGAALNKFAAVSNLPVISLRQSDLGGILARRMAYNASQVRATLTPGVSIELHTVGAAPIPLTGVCSDGCETYGPDKQSLIPMTAGGSRTILILLGLGL